MAFMAPDLIAAMQQFRHHAMPSGGLYAGGGKYRFTVSEDATFWLSRCVRAGRAAGGGPAPGTAATAESKNCKKQPPE